jgi:hypothetical protein
MGRGWFLRDILRQRRFWIIAGIVILVVFAGLWISLRQFGRADMNNPLALIHYWLQKSAEWQQHLTERASGWVQKIFDIVPKWMDVPLLLVYGIVRPFLPAALIDITTVPVWYGIAIWRAVGWTLLLPLLVYAPLRAFRKNQDSENGGLAIARGLCVVVWLGILVASFRAGGDEWDNVRYRVAFAGLQVALAAWALVAQRRSPDPWMRRILVGTALVLAWFIPWYLRRYLHIPWPVAEFFPTLAFGLASAGLYWIWDMKKKR